MSIELTLIGVPGQSDEGQAHFAADFYCDYCDSTIGGIDPGVFAWKDPGPYRRQRAPLRFLHARCLEHFRSENEGKWMACPLTVLQIDLLMMLRGADESRKWLVGVSPSKLKVGHPFEFRLKPLPEGQEREPRPGDVRFVQDTPATTQPEQACDGEALDG